MNQLTSRYDYDVKMRALAGTEQPDRVTFYGILMAAMQLADPDNRARLYWAFPEAAHEYFIRYLSPNGCLNVQEWLDLYRDLPEDEKPSHEDLTAIFQGKEQDADRNLALIRHNALAMDLIGLVPLSQAQIAAVVYKLRARGFFNEDQKPEVVDALVDLAVETARGDKYVTHAKNAPVENLIRAELEHANVFDIDQLPPRRPAADQEPGQAAGSNRRYSVVFHDDAVEIQDNGIESHYWHMDEWIEDPDVLFSIANAIRLIYTDPAALDRTSHADDLRYHLSRPEPGQAARHTGDTWAGRAPKEDPGPMQYLYCQGWYIYASNAAGYVYRLSTIQWDCWRHAPEDAHLQPFAVERYALTEAMADWDRHGPYWSPVQFEGGHLHVNDLNDQEHAPEDRPESPF